MVVGSLVSIYLLSVEETGAGSFHMHPQSVLSAFVIPALCYFLTV